MVYLSCIVCVCGIPIDWCSWCTYGAHMQSVCIPAMHSVCIPVVHSMYLWCTCDVCGVPVHSVFMVFKQCVVQCSKVQCRECSKYIAVQVNVVGVAIQYT